MEKCKYILSGKIYYYVKIGDIYRILSGSSEFFNYHYNEESFNKFYEIIEEEPDWEDITDEFEFGCYAAKSKNG